MKLTNDELGFLSAWAREDCERGKRGHRLRQEAWGRRKRCKKHHGNLS
jgi:hypothetical protein